jgi:hypothetical protein
MWILHQLIQSLSGKILKFDITGINPEFFQSDS